MRIAFYAPLKPPDHPAPSGDRQMARQLMAALELAGHQVELASRFRVFLRDAEASGLDAARSGAEREVSRLKDEMQRLEPPDMWFSYHPYYKSPDLIGAPLCRHLNIPYVTAEASLSSRRNEGAWRPAQALVAEAVAFADVNLCFTERDRTGLLSALPSARIARISPFIDTRGYQDMTPRDAAARLVTVAMMRPGDKFESYRVLAAALGHIRDEPWTLTIVGSGPARREVERLFDGFPASRFAWLGEVDPSRVPEVLCQGGVYVWPGCGEAYGLSYLEAQAAGLPVVAQETAGVPEVVCNGETGILTPSADVASFAAAIKRLLTSPETRMAMAAAARRFALSERSLDRAAVHLDRIVKNVASSR